MDSEVPANFKLEDLDDVENFCQWLEGQKFNATVVEAFKEEQVNGPAFLDLEEEDFKDMNLKKGPIKNLLRIQSKYKTSETQVSHHIMNHKN